jgi:diguanylate cyclase (GGDEF)-like protein/PAS domain S-box-containing protein
VNSAFTELLGYETSELTGRSWRSIYAREADLKDIYNYRIGLLSGQKVRGDVLVRRKDGVVLLLSVSATPFLADGEDTRWVVTTLRDVTHARREERRLREQASLDALTGLRNRREFERLLRKTIEMTPVDERAHVLMFIDLDGFKTINDTHGHDAGDRVLIAVGETLQRALLPSDDVSRWGGDEFAAILYFCTPEQAGVRAKQFIEALASNPGCRGVGASIGIVRILATATLSELMLRADRLVYDAKAAGRNRVMVEP